MTINLTRRIGFYLNMGMGVGLGMGVGMVMGMDMGMGMGLETEETNDYQSNSRRWRRMCG
jgi:hypothetical protein